MAVLDDHPLVDYFQREMDYLRARGIEFSRDHPKVAMELQLSQGRSADPHVELLTQSFAFLTARIQYQLESEYSEIPNHILSTLYPHLNAPVPAMAVAQAAIKADGTNFVNGFCLPRQRALYTQAVSGPYGTPKCRFQTCYDLDLWPLKVENAGIFPTNQYDFISDRKEVQSVLRVKIINEGHDPIHAYPMKNIRFFINGDANRAFGIYSLLRGHLCDMAVLCDRRENAAIWPKERLRWLGFDEEQAVLPHNEVAHPSYRILQEYFLFPEKYLFFEIEVPAPLAANREFELLFMLDLPIDKQHAVKDDTFLLNCVPLVNLFEKSIEPIRLDHRHYEYRVIGDQENHPTCEIHSIREVQAISPLGKPRPVVHFFQLDKYRFNETQDFFWSLRREASGLKSVPGTETFISFYDRRFDPVQPAEDVIAAKALCTNRRLPESLRAGHGLMLEGPGPVYEFRLITQPTKHQSPSIHGFKPWRLVSHLLLNHLSLSSHPQSLEAFKALLKLHAGDVHPFNRKQVESISSMECKRSVKRIGPDAWRGFCQGSEVTLSVDESLFEGGSPLLFGEVLSRFLALYATINSYVQLVFKSKQRKGIWKIWEPMVGEQEVL